MFHEKYYLVRHLDHNCQQGSCQGQAAELKMFLTTNSEQGRRLCTEWSPGGASRSKPANGLERSHPINPGMHPTADPKVLGQGRTLHNDQVINPRRRYNHFNKLLHGTWDLSSLSRDQTRIPCIARWILNHWATREVSQPALSYPSRLNSGASSLESPLHQPTWDAHP